MSRQAHGFTTTKCGCLYIVQMCPIHAKAPEMYEALKDIERYMMEDLDSIVGYLTTRDISQAKNLAQQSQVALAKRTRALLRAIEGDKL